MKKLLNQLDKWAAKAIQVIRPGKHRTSNVLTDDVHMKERQVSELPEDREELRTVMLPDDTYLTRDGQMIREPFERKRIIRNRSKYKKRI